MNVLKLNKEFENSTPQEVLRYFIDIFGKEVALSSSLGVEDQVLTDMMFKITSEPNIFTLDTGRLHAQTYRVMDETNLKYNTKLNVYFPSSNEVEKLYLLQGVNGHYESIDNRKRCCNIRKIVPLKRALQPLKVWVTGLRASQSVTRVDTPLIEYDKNFDVIKVNPLKDWSEEQVWEYIRANNVPYNKLHDEGFPSIGCEPCTRAVAKGADIRSGRWWWEDPEHKECGLHVKK